MKKIVVGCVLAAYASFGATVTWVGGNGTDLLTPGNWSPVGVPTTNDTVYFNLAGTYTLSGVITNDRANFTPSQAADMVLNFGANEYNLRSLFYVKNLKPLNIRLEAGTLSAAKGSYVSDWGVSNMFTVTGTGRLAGYGGINLQGYTNALIVKDGGYVTGAMNVLGRDSLFQVAAGGFAEIIDYGTWGDGQAFTIGNGTASQTGNRVHVTGGGVLYVRGNVNRSDGGICVGRDVASSDNSLVVDNGGVITNLGALYVDCGKIYSGTATAGGGWNNTAAFTNGFYFSRNFVRIGNGMMRDSGGGEFGFSNRLILAQNSVMALSNLVYVGCGVTSAWNSVEVSGGSKLLCLQGSAAGGLRIGEKGHDNTVLVTGGSFVQGTVQIGTDATAYGNRFVLEGSGTYLTNNYTAVGILVGLAGPGNTAEIRDGASAETALRMGVSNTSSNNLLRISGTGTYVKAVDYNNHPVTSAITLGGSGNAGCGLCRAEVTDGARLFITTPNVTYTAGLVIGNYSNSIGNVFAVSGGAVVTNSNRTRIGSFCNGVNQNNPMLGSSLNTLLVSNGTYNAGMDIHLGNSASSYSIASSNNTLIVAAGGVLTATYLTAGEGVETLNNALIVSGPSRVNVSATLAVGVNGTNTLFTVNGTAAAVTAGVMNVSAASGLLFNIGDSVEQNKTNALVAAGSGTILTGAQLAVNASEWARKKGGRIALVEYTGTAPATLAAFAATAVTDGYAVSVLGKTVYLTSPRKDGTVIRLF